jgi:hypothetical protein
LIDFATFFAAQPTEKARLLRIFSVNLSAPGRGIAFMLTLAGTPEPVVAADRVIVALAGGLTALIVHSVWAGSERLRIRKHKPPTVQLDAA